MTNKTKLPNDYEGIVYQIIRPTGLLDPVIEVRPAFPETFNQLKKGLEEAGFKDMPIFAEVYWDRTQVQDLMQEINKNVLKKQRVLVTTLTKRMSEELTDFLKERGINAKYLHSDIDSLERVEILKSLRKGEYDVLVGINLLREGLDLPEVSLVAILDADKEGFLRSQTSLVQTIGRAARHSEGRVLMYADKVTDSMKYAIGETRRRREIQNKYNVENGITPTTIIKEIKDQLDKFKGVEEESEEKEKDLIKKAESYRAMPKKERGKFIKELKFQMQLFADMMEFEKASEIRDLIEDLNK